MQIAYNDGPDRLTMGAAGTFERGVSRDIPDDLAKQILAKQSVIFQAVKPAKTKET